MDKEKIKEIADYYGRKEQLHQLMEECSELSVESSHSIRGRGSKADLAGEMADVIIMIFQCLYLEDIPEEDLKTLIQFKLDRQLRRIKDEQFRQRVKEN